MVTCCVCVFLLHRESPDMILGDKPLRDICDEPQIQTRFRCHNPIVLHCTIVRHVIGVQQGYAAKILFGLVARHKSILCRPLLNGFRTYPFLYTYVGSWYLETCGTSDASLLNYFLT
jgi:hypothetical protein